MAKLPNPVIKEHDGIMVVRDDLIEGGTKVRALIHFMGLSEEFVYASPAFGYAQIALAIAAREAGKRATIFTAKRAHLHPRTIKAKEAGAKIVQIPHGYLSNVKAKALAYSEAAGAFLFPFGLDFPEFIEALANVARDLPIDPSEIWCVAGSGVLCRALQRAFPGKPINAVRIGSAPNIGRAKLYFAPERYEQDAKDPPPFASCSNYDAKAWQFIKAEAKAGALFWNVGA